MPLLFHDITPLVDTLTDAEMCKACEETQEQCQKLDVCRLLSRLSASQARPMNHACHAAGAQLASSGLILPGSIVLMSLEELYRVSGLTDFFRIIYRELNHLRDLGLLDPRGA